MRHWTPGRTTVYDGVAETQLNAEHKTIFPVRNKEIFTKIIRNSTIKMEIHDRFMKLSTTGVIVLEILTDNPERKSSIIRELVEACYKKICKGSSDLKILEIFRMILSYEYQSFVNSRNDENALEPKESTYIDIRKFFVRDTDHILNTEEFAILYDIAVLQMVLRSNQQQIVKSFQDFYNSQKEHLTTRHENKNLSMRVYECFADTCNLRSYLYKRENREKDFDELLNIILTVIGSWMDQEENLEWRLLASILPKLILTFGSKNILTPLWNKVLVNTENLNKTLTTLCLMADVSFPSEETKIDQTPYKQWVRKEFWAILLQGLVSTVYQERKQTLFLVKRALDLMDSHKAEILKELESAITTIVPFVLFMNVEKEMFLVILEALEEKHNHLVLPALMKLPSLVKAYSKHTSRYNSFNVAWLQCIFKRILQHDSYAVQIIVLREILNADLDIYDNEFLDDLVNHLNNTFLYEYDRVRVKQPDIVGQMEDFFVRSEESKRSLINMFVRSISRVSWDPVPIYWILVALVGATDRKKIIHNAWTIEELKCVKNLFEKSLTINCRTLRDRSLELIRKAFCAYVPSKFGWSDDVELIINAITSGKFELCPEIEDNVTEFLAIIIKRTDAQSCVKRICEEILMHEGNTEPCAQKILVLLHSKLIDLTIDCPGGQALRQLFKNLIEANCRPDANESLVLRLIEFMSHLVSGSSFNGIDNIKMIEWCVIPYIDVIFNVCNRSFEKTAILTSDKYILAIKVLRDYASTCSMFTERTAAWPDLANTINGLESRCLNIIKNPYEFSINQRSHVLRVMHVCRTVPLFSPHHELSNMHILLILRYFRNVVTNDDEIDDTESNGQSMRKLRSHCSDTIVKLVYQHMYTEDIPPNVRWAEELLFLLKNGTEAAISPIICLLQRLIENYPELILEDLDIVYDIICRSWQRTFELERNNVFVEALSSLTDLIINSSFLKWDRAKEIGIDCVHQLIRDGDGWSILISGFLNCLEYLQPDKMLYFHEPLISCLLYGTALSQDQRIARATIWHVETYVANSDLEVRTESTVIFLTILRNFEGVECEVRENILKKLIGTLKKNRNERYSKNPHIHVLKQRVMQTLLIMEPFLDADERQILHDAICDLLIVESNQPSVRLMQEWILVRIYAKNPIMRDSLWGFFEKTIKNRPESIASIVGIIFHVSRLLEEETKIQFIAKSISHLLPNCMSQQFNVQLYSQAILVKIYNMLPGNCPEAAQYRAVYEGIQESFRRGNITKKSFEIMDNFYFEIFHANNDYNWETIYYHIPRLTGVFVDEWMGFRDYELFWWCGCDDRNLIRQSPLKSCNALAVVEPRTVPSPRPTGELNEEIDSSTHSDPDDVEKQIMLPYHNELLDVSKAAFSRRKVLSDDAGIIVIASLIDHPPSLGELARTCEIFGAKELVIGTLRYADHREFQTLSVSAEKLLTITEVKPHLLQNYLLEKQSKGWKLVGAEQTANSTNLLEMEFDKKTILLLGNEKNGIPANLIPLLDTCVKISENRVVRSLNVHVTGAICIWQYTKQHPLA